MGNGKRRPAPAAERIRPLSPLPPFSEGDSPPPVPPRRTGPPGAGRASGASAALPGVALPAAVRQSLLDEAGRRRYATYTRFGQAEPPDPPKGALFSAKA